MPVSKHHAGLIADALIVKHKLKPEAKVDLVRLAPEFTDDDAYNEVIFRKWIEGEDIGGVARDHVKVEQAKLDDDRINIEAERLAFGPGGAPAGRAALSKLYGGELFEQRRVAWGADKGVMASGTEPGVDQAKVAAKQIAGEAARQKRRDGHRTLQSRREEVRVGAGAGERLQDWFVRYGTASARRECVRFNVDIAGRPLRAKPRR